MQIHFRRIHPDTPLPEYKTDGACAFDIAVIEGGVLQSGEFRLFRTGLVITVPDGHALILAPRSSNAKKGVRLSNGVGIIDQDYCGPEDELKIALHNFSQTVYEVQPGERIAQGMFIPILRASFVEQTESQTTSSRGGFGSTGLL